jgi:drug/metabolite transporter (DMT)-like permease
MVLLGLSSAAFEAGHVGSVMEGGWLLAGLVLFSALVVSVFAHSVYFAMIQRYEANLVAPITLISPLMAIGLGIWLTNDYFDLRMALGSAVAVLGVLLVAMRSTMAARTAVLFRKQF